MYNDELEHINKDYFDWLYSQIEERDDAYLELCSHLHNVEFSYDTALLIPNDHNRIEDSLGLRERFEREEMKNKYSRYLEDSFYDQPCTVFEIFVALSYRMEGVVMSDQFPEWFWILIDNLGLDVYTNDRMGRRSIVEIDHILDDWMNRRYDRDGTGGLFPLKNPPSDQRKEEIWHQMSAYLLEMWS